MANTSRSLCSLGLVLALVAVFSSPHLALPATAAGKCGLETKLVRPIASEWESDYGIDGVSIIALAGEAQHGMKDVEVFLITQAAGVGSPIHFHEQEEVVVVLKGKATMYVLEDGKKKEYILKTNSTTTLPPKLVHQVIANLDTEIQFMAAVSQPPFKFNILPTWETPLSDAIVPPAPMSKCPPETKDEL